MEASRGLNHVPARGELRPVRCESLQGLILNAHGAVLQAQRGYPSNSLRSQRMMVGSVSGVCPMWPPGKTRRSGTSTPSPPVTASFAANAAAACICTWTPSRTSSWFTCPPSTAASTPAGSRTAGSSPTPSTHGGDPRRRPAPASGLGGHFSTSQRPDLVAPTCRMVPAARSLFKWYLTPSGVMPTRSASLRRVILGSDLRKAQNSFLGSCLGSGGVVKGIGRPVLGGIRKPQPKTSAAGLDLPLRFGVSGLLAYVDDPPDAASPCFDHSGAKEGMGDPRVVWPRRMFPSKVTHGPFRG